MSGKLGLDFLHSYWFTHTHTHTHFKAGHILTTRNTLRWPLNRAHSRQDLMPQQALHLKQTPFCNGNLYMGSGTLLRTTVSERLLLHPQVQLHIYHGKKKNHIKTRSRNIKFSCTILCTERWTELKWKTALWPD